MAERAFSFHETIGEEPLILLAVWQNEGLFVNVAVGLDLFVELSNEILVNRAFSSGIVVESNIVSFQKSLYQLMILVGEMAGTNPLLQGLHFNRGSVLVAPTHQYYFFSLEPEVSCVYIG